MRQILHTFRVNRNLQDTCPVYVACCFFVLFYKCLFLNIFLSCFYSGNLNDIYVCYKTIELEVGQILQYL